MWVQHLEHVIMRKINGCGVQTLAGLIEVPSRRGQYVWLESTPSQLLLPAQAWSHSVRLWTRLCAYYGRPHSAASMLHHAHHIGSRWMVCSAGFFPFVSQALIKPQSDTSLKCESVYT
jgi:hypothetical protein